MASREYSTWKRRPSGEKVLREGELEVPRTDMVGYTLDATIWRAEISKGYESLG
jgi:hypothetical protein